MSEKYDPDRVISEIPNIYFNGFQLGLSNADINGILLLNNEAQLGINMSYTTAKTLADALNSMVEALEGVTDKNIMTTQQVGQGLDRLKNKSGARRAESK